MRPVVFYELQSFLVSIIIGSEETFFRGAAVDSRVCEPGQLFVALPGEHTDGHLFIPELLQKGVRAFLISSFYAAENPDCLYQWAVDNKASFLVVSDTLRALQKIAEWYLEQMPQVQRIGITGSSGKTTVKELTAAVLKRKYRTVYTSGNLNSEIGLPLVALSVDPDDEIAVFEMGINHPGEMDVLAGIVKPQTAIITNIFPAHIGMFENVDAIAGEKMKIFSYAGDLLTAFVNRSDRYTELYRQNYPGNYILCGMGTTDRVTIVENRGFDGWVLEIGGYEAVTPLFGRHNLENICVAVAVGRAYGVSDSEIADGIASVGSVGFGRSCIKRGRVTVIEDCYNANPGSMEAAVSLFRETTVKGRKIFVAGAMKELGVHAPFLHAEMGRMLAAAAFDSVVFFGEEAGAAFEAYHEAGGGNARFFTDMEKLQNDLRQEVKTGDWIFLKGSRSLCLERLESVLE